MTSPKDTPAPTIRDIATDALRYWEPRRLIYNAVLAVIVLGYFFAGWPASKPEATLDAVLGLFLLAVLANVAYCAAYIADVFIQLSGFRAPWSRFRWLLFILGTAFAAILTRFFSMGLVHAAQ